MRGGEWKCFKTDQVKQIRPQNTKNSVSFSGPRGEIVVGGPLVANGYYNLPEKTAESFYEENGTKWFRTGNM